MAAPESSIPPKAEDLQRLRAAAATDLREVEFARESLANSPNQDTLDQALAALATLTRRNIEMTFAVERLTNAVAEGKAPKIESEPLNFVLVRHGRSVGNERERILALPPTDPIRELYLKTPNFQLPLVHLGRKQAETAGKWMKENLGFEFDAAFCPDFVRSQQTAGISGQVLGLKVPWRESGLFGERSWGDFERLSQDEQHNGYERRKNDPRHWAPPEGEPMHLLELGVRLALGTLHRKYGGKNVIVSTHGERINAFRSVIERLPTERFSAIMDEGPPNGGVVQYTRQDPETGAIADHWGWVRLVCPWDPSVVKANEAWDGKWRKIERPEYSSEELLRRADAYPQIYDRSI